MSKKIEKKPSNSTEAEKFPLSVYKKEDDIYSRKKKESLEDEDNPEMGRSGNRKVLGGNLDIPGAELDDANEEIGEEDEENNYYSLGGDNYGDRDRDHGN